jgi:hypothetical protein
LDALLFWSHSDGALLYNYCPLEVCAGMCVVASVSKMPLRLLKSTKGVWIMTKNIIIIADEMATLIVLVFRRIIDANYLNPWKSRLKPSIFLAQSCFASRSPTSFQDAKSQNLFVGSLFGRSLVNHSALHTYGPIRRE